MLKGHAVMVEVSVVKRATHQNRRLLVAAAASANVAFHRTQVMFYDAYKVG